MSETSKQSGKGGGRKRNGYRGRKGRSWKAACEELGHHVYIVDRSNSAEKVVTTTEAIAKYIGRTLDYGADIERAIMEMKHIDWDTEKPADIDEATATLAEREIYKSEMKAYGIRKTQYKKNCGPAFNLLLGQCSPDTVDKLKHVFENWNEFDISKNFIALLKKLKELCHGLEAHKHPIMLIKESCLAVFGGGMRQHKEGTPAEYKIKFDEKFKVMESHGAKIDMRGYLEKDEEYSKAVDDDTKEHVDNQLEHCTFFKTKEQLEYETKRHEDTVKAVVWAEKAKLWKKLMPKHDDESREDWKKRMIKDIGKQPKDATLHSDDENEAVKCRMVYDEIVKPEAKRQKKLEDKARSKFLAMHFLATARGSKAEEVMTQCQNDWNAKKDTFPNNVSEALTKIDNHQNINKEKESQSRKGKRKSSGDGEDEETNFAGVGDGKGRSTKKPRKNGPSRKQCTRCGKAGHEDADCWENPNGRNFNPDRSLKMMHGLLNPGKFVVNKETGTIEKK